MNSKILALTLVAAAGTTAYAQPASSTDLGDLTAAAYSSDTVINLTAANEVRWFLMKLPAVVAAGAGYVDMWATQADPTLAITASDLNDTDLALYRAADGTLVAYNDATGPGLFGQLSFGSTVSRGTTTATGQTAGGTRAGVNGALTEGFYYLAVAQYNMAHPTPLTGAWTTVTSNYAGTARNTNLHISTLPNTAPTPPVVSGGACTPSTALTGTSRLLTVNVAQGTNPASPIASVVADLTAVGGANNAGFHNDGLNGDVSAADNIWSYEQIVTAAPGTATITVTATDSLAVPRAGTGTISVGTFAVPTSFVDVGDLSVGSHTVDAPVALSSPTNIQWVKMILPPVAAASVGYVDITTTPTADPSPATDVLDTEIGLYAASGDGAVLLNFNDDDSGANAFSSLTFGSTSVSRGPVTFPGLTAGQTQNGSDGPLAGGVYYLAVGAYNVNFAANGFGATGTYAGTQTTMNVHIVTTDGLSPTPPTISTTSATVVGGGLATSGSTMLLTATVAPGANPTSAGITVTGDTTSIGGGPGAVFHDDGLNGDVAIDGVYSYQTVATGAAGPHPVPLVVADNFPRSGSGSVSVNLVSIIDAGTIAGTDSDPTTSDVISNTHTQVLGQISWMKFTIAAAVQDDADTGLPGTWLDIDTETTGAEGSVINSLGDTYIGGYSSSGALLGTDDDSGTYFRSQLTFGDVSPTRPGIVSADTLDTGLAGDGSNGNLAVGTYYLALGNFACTMGANFAATTTNTVAAGDYVVNFRTNLPPSQCSAADVGVQGGGPGQDRLLNNNDFIAFIDLFFAQSAAADLGQQGGIPGADQLWDNNDFIVFIDTFFNDSANCQG